MPTLRLTQPPLAKDNLEFIDFFSADDCIARTGKELSAILTLQRCLQHPETGSELLRDCMRERKERFLDCLLNGATLRYHMDCKNILTMQMIARTCVVIISDILLSKQTESQSSRYVHDCLVRCVNTQEKWRTMMSSWLHELTGKPICEKVSDIRFIAPRILEIFSRCLDVACPNEHSVESVAFLLHITMCTSAAMSLDPVETARMKDACKEAFPRLFQCTVYSDTFLYTKNNAWCSGACAIRLAIEFYKNELTSVPEVVIDNLCTLIQSKTSFIFKNYQRISFSCQENSCYLHSVCLLAMCKDLRISHMRSIMASVQHLLSSRAIQETAARCEEKDYNIHTIDMSAVECWKVSYGAEPLPPSKILAFIVRTVEKALDMVSTNIKDDDDIRYILRAACTVTEFISSEIESKQHAYEAIKLLHKRALNLQSMKKIERIDSMHSATDSGSDCDTKSDSDDQQKVLDELQYIKPTLNKSKKALTRAKARIEAVKKELEAKNEELEARNEELEARNKELEAKNKELDSAMEELVKVDDEINLAKSTLAAFVEDKNKIVAEATQTKSDCEAQLELQRKQRAEAQAELANMRKTAKADQKALEIAKNEYIKMQSELRLISKEVADKREEMDRINKEKHHLDCAIAKMNSNLADSRCILMRADGNAQNALRALDTLSSQTMFLQTLLTQNASKVDSCREHLSQYRQSYAHLVQDMCDIRML